MVRRMGNGSGSKNLVAWALVILSLVVGAMVILPSLNIGGGAAPAAVTGGGTTAEVISAVGDASFCSNNADVDLEIRLEDNIGSTVAYRNATLLIQNVENPEAPILTVRDITGTTVTFNDVTNVLKCGKPYKVFVQTNLNGTSSLSPAIDLPADKTRADPVQIPTSGVTTFSTLEVRFKSYEQDAFLVPNISNGVALTDAVIAPGQIVNFTNTAANATGLTIGTSGIYSGRMELRTSQDDQVFGAPYGFYVAMDTGDDNNVDDWDENRVSLSGPASIPCTDVTGTMNANDRAALTAFEKIYHCKGVISGRSARMPFDVSFVAGTGVNPDYNPGLRFVALGDYQSSQKPNTILQGVGFRDDSSTRTALTSVQRVGFVIV